MSGTLRFDEWARGGNQLAGVLSRLMVTVPGLLIGAGLFVGVAFDAPGWLVWLLLVAFVLGLALPVWALVRIRRLVGVLELGPDGVERTVAGERLRIAWAGVRSLSLVPNYLTGETLLVLETDPPDALLPTTRQRLPRRLAGWLGRCCGRLYGGAIVLPLTGCGLPEAEARQRVAAYAGLAGISHR